MNRSNVLIVIFDLPAVTKEDARNYRRFRKYILSSGFIFIQESVYVKLLRSHTTCKSEIKALSDNAPDDSQIMTITMSLNEFSKTIFLKKSGFDLSVFSDPVISF